MLAYLKRNSALHLSGFACLLSALCLAPTVAAQEGESLVIRSTGLPEERAFEFIRAIRERWAAEGHALSPIVGEAPPIDLLPELERARLAYNEMRPEEALRILEAMRIAGEREGGRGLSRPRWAQVHLQIALAALALGDEQRGVEALDGALSTLPGLELDATQYPPAFRERLESRRSHLERASVHLTLSPQGAQVWLDNEPVVGVSGLGFGSPGIRLQDVPQGQHLLRVEAPGFFPRHEVLTLGEGFDTLSITLERDPGAALRTPGAPSSRLEPRLLSAIESRAEPVWVLDLVGAGTPTGTSGNGRVQLRIFGPDGRRGEAGPAVEPRVLAASLWTAALPLAQRLIIGTGTGEGENGADVEADEPLLAWILGGSGAALVLGVGVAVLVVTLSPEPAGFSASGTRSP